MPTLEHPRHQLQKNKLWLTIVIIQHFQAAALISHHLPTPHQFLRIISVLYFSSLEYLPHIISSDRSSYSDNGLLYVQLFQIFTQSIDAIDVTSDTLSRLNIINAIIVTRC